MQNAIGKAQPDQDPHAAISGPDQLQRIRHRLVEGLLLLLDPEQYAGKRPFRFDRLLGLSKTERVLGIGCFRQHHHRRQGQQQQQHDDEAVALGDHAGQLNSTQVR